MSRMTFDVIERAPPRMHRGRIVLRFLFRTTLLAAILFWITLVILV